MACGPTWQSRPTGLYEPCPILEWNMHALNPQPSQLQLHLNTTARICTTWKLFFFINSINVTKDKVVVKRFSCLTNVTDKFTVTYIQCESKNWTLFIWAQLWDIVLQQQQQQFLHCGPTCSLFTTLGHSAAAAATTVSTPWSHLLFVHNFGT